MPTIPILVEGDTDAAFFANLIQRMSLPEDIQFETRSAEGKGNLPDLAKALASGAFERFVIAQDLDRQTSQQIIQSHRDSLSSRLGVAPTDLSGSGDDFRVGDVTVSVIPVGLPDNADLRTLGITSHALEDYLVQLLVVDCRASAIMGHIEG